MKTFIASLSFLLTTIIWLSCASEKPSQTQQDLAPITSVKSTMSSISPITLDDVMGKFIPAEDDDFVIIDMAYASRENMYLHKDTYSAFLKMHAAAKEDSINLTIRSATRNFYDQKRIWENKWNGNTLVEGGQNLAKTVADPKDRALIILKFSSMPGSSRHHWGTDIDINNFENNYFESGQGLKEYNWLVENAPSFGFCQPYTAKDNQRPNGYNEEKWHWSYLPVAVPLTRFVEKHLLNNMIEGFEGATTAQAIDIKTNYMLGINKTCLAE